MLFRSLSRVPPATRRDAFLQRREAFLRRPGSRPPSRPLPLPSPVVSFSVPRSAAARPCTLRRRRRRSRAQAWTKVSILLLLPTSFSSQLRLIRPSNDGLILQIFQLLRLIPFHVSFRRLACSGSLGLIGVDCVQIKREIVTLKLLKHPNVVRIYEVSLPHLTPQDSLCFSLLSS